MCSSAKWNDLIMPNCWAFKCFSTIFSSRALDSFLHPHFFWKIDPRFLSPFPKAPPTLSPSEIAFFLGNFSKRKENVITPCWRYAFVHSTLQLFKACPFRFDMNWDSGCILFSTRQIRDPWSNFSQLIRAKASESSHHDSAPTRTSEPRDVLLGSSCRFILRMVQLPLKGSKRLGNVWLSETFRYFKDIFWTLDSRHL